MNTIKFWLMPNGGFESKQTIDKELSFFRKKNPKMEVDLEIFSWSRAWFRLMRAIKEKSGPDVIQIGTTWIGTLGYLGAVRKLDKRIGKNNKFLPAFLKMCRSYGHLWAIPWFCEGRVLYYRKDMLAAANIEPESVRGWESFRLACAKIARATGNAQNACPIAFSGQKEQVILQDIAAWIWSNGGDFLSKDHKHATLTQPETKQGLKYFAQLVADKYISKDSVEQTAVEVAENFFMQDTNAFMFSSSWPLKVYLNPASKHYIGRENAQKYGIMPIPAGPAGKFNFMGGSALAVTSFSRNPEEAAKLVEFLTGRESVSRYCRNINMLPGRNDVPAALDADKGTLKVFRDAIGDSGRSFPIHPMWGSIEQIILNGISHTLREYIQTGCSQNSFFRNISDINHEIEYMLSVFGE